MSSHLKMRTAAFSGSNPSHIVIKRISVCFSMNARVSGGGKQKDVVDSIYESSVLCLKLFLGILIHIAYLLFNFIYMKIKKQNKTQQHQPERQFSDQLKLNHLRQNYGTRHLAAQTTRQKTWKLSFSGQTKVFTYSSVKSWRVCLEHGGSCTPWSLALPLLFVPLGLVWVSVKSALMS